MEGLGNGYIVLNGLEGGYADPAGLAVELCDRHFGVGGDGLICICSGRDGDFSMEMWNADGSRGAMCGSGLCCLGKYLYEKRLISKRALTIDTDGGTRALELEVRSGSVERVAVHVGRVTLLPWVEEQWDGEHLRLYPARMGNPHAVCFCANPDNYPLEQVGPFLEHSKALKQRSNIEFVSVPAEDRLHVRVWERGSGMTLGCGTGACAAFGAARAAGLCEKRVAVRLPGGVLQVEERKNGVWMTGPARTVFEGVWKEKKS